MGSLLIVASLVSVPGTAAAVKLTTDICETPSYGRAALGEDYYDLTPFSISAETSAALNDFYEKLQGRWSGEMIDRPCTRMTDDHPREPKHYLLDNTTTDLQDNGLFILRTEKKRIEPRPGSGKHKIVAVVPNTRLDFLPGKDLSALEMPDSNTVTAVARYQQRNAASQGTSRTSLRERQDTLMLVGDTLLIQTRWYINGYYTGTESLRLTRQN